METIALKSLVKNGTVRTISNLRMNVNEYPYLTFLDSKGSSTNIYFGQKSGIIIKDTFEENQSVIAAIKDSNIIKYLTPENEVRYKIILNTPSSKYASDSELMDAFGIEEIETEFNIEEFRKEFAAKPVVEASKQPK